MMLSRKWMAILCAMLILLGALAVFGIRAVTSFNTNEEEKPWKASETTEEYPFVLTIATKNDTYEPCELVDIQITLKNIGDKNATMLFTTKPNPSVYWFWCVFDENGWAVFYWKTIGRLQMVDRITLQPNESIGLNCTWDQKDTRTETQVPLGFYYLTATVSFMYGEDFNNGTGINLESQKRIAISNP